MNAILEAKAMYERHGMKHFEQDLQYYLVNGVVISRPDRFLMAKVINSTRLDDDEWNPPDADTWYVHCAVGRGALEWFLKQAPIRLPKLAWRRFKNGANRLRCYNTDAFERFAQ